MRTEHLLPHNSLSYSFFKTLQQAATRQRHVCSAVVGAVLRGNELVRRLSVACGEVDSWRAAVKMKVGVRFESDDAVLVLVNLI